MAPSKNPPEYPAGSSPVEFPEAPRKGDDTRAVKPKTT